MDGLHAVRSPVVGTFYRAPAPGEDPYVQVGDTVSAGQTLCIVEAMKLMNEIVADVPGEVVEVLAENAGGVEYDQPLFYIAARRTVVIGKVLVANRGEIALRIIRACRELGVRSVAVYSTADRDSLHHELADESICIGPPPAVSSYLNVPAIISAAELTGADAVHPGYGFLAENARFAEICERVGLKFVGPASGTIARMGDKAVAREAAAEAGVPVTPGSDGPCESVEEVKRVGAEVGYPLVIKASAGGGGKGMRVVEAESEVEAAYLGASREAGANFGDGSVYVEKYCLERLRHVEVQVLADSHGETVTFPERDCSIQRRCRSHRGIAGPRPAGGRKRGSHGGLLADLFSALRVTRGQGPWSSSTRTENSTLSR